MGGEVVGVGESSWEGVGEGAGEYVEVVLAGAENVKGVVWMCVLVGCCWKGAGPAVACERVRL